MQIFASLCKIHCEDAEVCCLCMGKIPWISMGISPDRSGNINSSNHTSFRPVFCHRFYLVCDLCKYNRILYNSLCTGREELVLVQVFPLSQVSRIDSEHEVSSVHI